MSLIYITGPTAAGKSTVCTYLQEKGYEAYDIDADEMSPERVALLAEQARNKTIFLCGAAENDIELAHYFSKIICLVIGIKTVKRRIAVRTTSNFGKSADDLAQIIAWHQRILDKYAIAGATMIDASQPIDDVVSKILHSINN